MLQETGKVGVNTSCITENFDHVQLSENEFFHERYDLQHEKMAKIPENTLVIHLKSE